MATAAAAAATTCGFCTETLAGKPQFQTLCGHVAHTECLLRATFTDDLLHIRCHTCQERLVPTAMYDEMTAVHGDAAQREIAEYMWVHEPRFKQDLLDLRIAAIQKRKTKWVAAKTAVAAKEQIETDMSAEITAIKERIATAKTTYKDSEARKAMMKAETAYTRLVDNLHKRWGLSVWSARRALGAVPDAARCLDHRTWGRRGYIRMQALNITLE